MIAPEAVATVGALRPRAPASRRHHRPRRVPRRRRAPGLQLRAPSSPGHCPWNHRDARRCITCRCTRRTPLWPCPTVRSAPRGRTFCCGTRPRHSASRSGMFWLAAFAGERQLVMPLCGDRRAPAEITSALPAVFTALRPKSSSASSPSRLSPPALSRLLRSKSLPCIRSRHDDPDRGRARGRGNC